MASAFGAGVTNKGLIGSGAFGKVYLVENQDKEQFAVKVMDISSIDDRLVADNELDVLQKLAHENVLAYVEHFVHHGALYVITEYCHGGDLSGFLDKLEENYGRRGVPEDLILVWLWQMLCGLEYMHTGDPPILHRDLKPSNIYLTAEGDIRLGDMGIARTLERPDAMAETFCGTPPYMSPEALYEKPYNAKTDIWSLGCCLMEMATLSRAYDGSTIFILRNAVLKQRESLPFDTYTRDLDQLVGKMLRKEFESRASASDLLDDLEGGYFVVRLGQECNMPSPGDLLDKHGLLGCMGIDRDPTSGGSGGTLHTMRDLSESMSNIRNFIGPGETMTSYHVKIESRRRSRRPPEDTIINSDNLKTVLRKSQTVKTKVHKKSMPSLAKAPERSEPKEPQQPQEALPPSAMSALTSTLSTQLSTMRLNRTKETETQTPPVSPPAVPSLSGNPNASRADQVATLRQILTRFAGVDSMNSVSQLVTSDLSSMDVMAGLDSVFDLESMVGSGDRNTKAYLSQLIVYLVLLDSAGLSRSSST